MTKDDVFVSFRGQDVRKTLLSHLLRSFRKIDITTFTASESSNTSLQALQDSLVAILVISKNHASLDLWVDDLANMIKHEENGTLTAVPIFFELGPLDISNILTEAGNKAQRTQGLRRKTLENVKKWLDGHVTNKSAFISNDCKDDAELVGKVTSFVSDILTSSSRSDLPSPRLRLARSLKLLDPFRSDPVVKKDEPSVWRIRENYRFMSSHVEALRAKLLRGESTTVTGVCGIRGVGKKSLVRHVYGEISPRFQYHLWIRPQDISCSRPNSLLNDLASLKGSSSFNGRSNDAIKEMIQHRKVLFVADGVDDIKQLKGIIKDSSWFGSGSRVIVITQEKSLLDQCGVKHRYELKCPNNEEALAFFSEFAFNRKNPPLGFEDLSLRAVQVSNRLPLALKLLGSFLCNKEKDEWVSTLRRLQDTHNNYATEVCRYIGAEDYTARRPMKVDQHVDEANRLPFYRFALN